MSRGLVEGLAVRHTLGEALPAMFQEDRFVQRLCSALDEVVAPISMTLDNLWAYLDPTLTPDDLLEWLASWVGVEVDQTWPRERRRQLVARAMEIGRWQGTARGIAELVELYVGTRPEIVDGGGTAVSIVPDGELPGQATDEFVVRLDVADHSTVEVARLERLVRAAAPAHLLPRIEVVTSPSRLPPPPPSGSAGS